LGGEVSCGIEAEALGSLLRFSGRRLYSCVLDIAWQGARPPGGSGCPIKAV
jgi:hypothetical protein